MFAPSPLSEFALGSLAVLVTVVVMRLFETRNSGAGYVTNKTHYGNVYRYGSSQSNEDSVSEASVTSDEEDEDEDEASVSEGSVSSDDDTCQASDSIEESECDYIHREADYMDPTVNYDEDNEIDDSDSTRHARAEELALALEEADLVSASTLAPVEPLSVPIPGCNPYTMFPVMHNDIWAVYKSMQSLRWFPEEVNLSQDLAHWDKLSEGQRHFLKSVLGFFAASDGIVSANLAERFINECPWATVKAVYTEQMSIEQIHSEMYSLLIDKYVTDQSEKNDLFNAVETLPAVKGKADWALRWVNDHDASFAQRMVAFAIVEGVFFAGSFCAIFWMREQGLLPGLCQANDMIARDEGMHTDFACLLYTRYVVNKLSFDEIKRLMVEAVEVEVEFINEAIPCRLLGMNAANMKQYIEFMADRITNQLGYPDIYGSANPFPFMSRAGAAQHVNFFEHRNTEYSRAATSVGDLNAQAIVSAGDDF